MLSIYDLIYILVHVVTGWYFKDVNDHAWHLSNAL